MNMEIFLKYLGIWGKKETIPCPDVTDSIMIQLQQAEEIHSEWMTLLYFGSATTLSAAFSLFISFYQIYYSSSPLERLFAGLVSGGF